MLDMKFIRNNPDLVEESLKNRNEKIDLKELLSLDEKWRNLMIEADELKHIRNVVSEEIKDLKKVKRDATEKISQMREVSNKIKSYDEEINSLEDKMEKILVQIPNVAHKSVPAGESETDNIEIKRWGEPPEFDFKILDHIELSKRLNIIDFMRASKISGSGFPLYKGWGAKLERALINFMMDVHSGNGYSEIIPPLMVTEESAFGTGQLPKLKDDMYFCDEDGLYLIPTAEVPVTNIYKGEILKAGNFPINLVSYTPCFRREAGSWGKDTRGFNRMHQFNKVELVKFTLPENSYDELEILLNDAEKVLQLLDLHYRVVELCTGELSFAAAKCYDIEVWSPADKKYLEVSSCSNFEDFQTRRIGIRFRRERGKKPEYPHTLNGSGVATARLMIAILETYQTDEYTLMVPDVLKDYVGTSVIKL